MTTVTIACENGHSQQVKFDASLDSAFVREWAALLDGTSSFLVYPPTTESDALAESIGIVPIGKCGICRAGIRCEIGEESTSANIGEAPPSADRTQQTLTDGSPVTEDHRDINPATGQQKGYVVLSQEERAKGFVRPLRDTYIHVGESPEMRGTVLIRAGSGGCGTRTTMGRAIAETYARDPGFYSGTFCCSCRKHLPLDQFIWEGTTERVGS